MSQMNVSSLNEGYQKRVRDKQEWAQATEAYSKKLEVEEAQLLNKLQKTY